MDKLKIVIEHLQDCIDYMDRDRTRHWVFVRGNVVRAASQLLKAQEPRVMTLEEARNNAYSFFYTPDSVKPVFVQFRDETYADESMTPPWRGGVNQRALLKEPDRYGKDFLFWTDRPSEDQRKDVEWK